MFILGITEQIDKAKEMAKKGYSISQICSSLSTTSIFVFKHTSEELFSLEVNQKRYPKEYKSFVAQKKNEQELANA